MGNKLYFLFNRKEKNNAFSKEMLNEINKSLEEVTKNEEIKYVIFRGENGCFGAGADLREVQELTNNSLKAREFAYALNSFFRKVAEMNKITIALVEGFAIGAHLELLMFTDINIAQTNTYFSTGGVRMGLMPAELSAIYLLFFGKKFWRYIITAERFNAEVAKELGIIDFVADNPMDKLKEVIESLDACDFLAIQKAKKLMQDFLRLYEKNFDKAKDEFADLIIYGKAKERIKSFFEKR